MHELSLCINMLKIVGRQAVMAKINAVTQIWLEVGMLTSVEKDALFFSFPIAAKNTIAENAQLHIIDVPGKAKCLQCQIELDVNTLFNACPHCGNFGLEIIEGTELRLRDMEVI